MNSTLCGFKPIWPTFGGDFQVKLHKTLCKKWLQNGIFLYFCSIYASALSTYDFSSKSGYGNAFTALK